MSIYRLFNSRCSQHLKTFKYWSYKWKNCFEHRQAFTHSVNCPEDNFRLVLKSTPEVFTKSTTTHERLRTSKSKLISYLQNSHFQSKTKSFNINRSTVGNTELMSLTEKPCNADLISIVFLIKTWGEMGFSEWRPSSRRSSQTHN